jgi:hypothetical protein
MKLHLHNQSHILVIGNSKTIKNWNDLHPGQVLGMGVDATSEESDCRVIQVNDEFEDLIEAIPVFSAVIFDGTGANFDKYIWHDGTSKEWMSKAVVQGGYLIFYDLPESMPDRNSWRWNSTLCEPTIHFGPTDRRIGTQLICCAIAKCTGGFARRDDCTANFCDLPWYTNLNLTLPKAKKEAHTFDRTEYTSNEIETLAENDTSLIDLAHQGYKTTSIESPPLELGVGHLGLLIASGQLAGRITTQGEPPHVMRGVSRKVERVHSDDRGREITTENVEVIVRTVDDTGKIMEYTA